MHNRNIRLAVRVGMFCFGAACLAQTAAPPPPLSLAQAVSIALQNHPRIAAAQNLESAAGQRVTEARAPYYPVINAEVTASQAYYGSRIGAGTLQASMLFNRQGEGLVANQLITDLGRTRNLVASARLQSQAAVQTTRATQEDVILAVYRAYFGALESQALVRVAEETVTARQTLADQVAELGRAQLKSQVDVSFANVNLSEARLLLIRAQDNLQEAFVELARALGQDTPPVQYQLTESGVPAASPSSIDNLIAQAIQNRPDLADLRLRYQAAQKFAIAERDLKHPNVNLVAVGGALPYLDQNPRVTPDAYEGVAVNVEVPIFNGHAFSAREEAARYEAEAANQRARDLQQQVNRDVRAAWLSTNTAFQRIPVTTDLVNQARLAQDLAKGRYDLGLASIVELSQAQLNLTQAEIENVNAQYDYQTALAVLQYTTGTLR
jgi:outer membrane protein